MHRPQNHTLCPVLLGPPRFPRMHESYSRTSMPAGPVRTLETPSSSDSAPDFGDASSSAWGRGVGVGAGELGAAQGCCRGCWALCAPSAGITERLAPPPAAEPLARAEAPHSEFRRQTGPKEPPTWTKRVGTEMQLPSPQDGVSLGGFHPAQTPCPPQSLECRFSAPGA